MYLHAFFSIFLKHESMIFDFCKKRDHWRPGSKATFRCAPDELFFSLIYFYNNTCPSTSKLQSLGILFSSHGNLHSQRIIFFLFCLTCYLFINNSKIIAITTVISQAGSWWRTQTTRRSICQRGCASIILIKPCKGDCDCCLVNSQCYPSMDACRKGCVATSGIVATIIAPSLPDPFSTQFN